MQRLALVHALVHSLDKPAALLLAWLRASLLPAPAPAPNATCLQAGG